jgi:uroporphyrinogen-III synthase
MKQTLFGRNILVTRAMEQQAELVSALQERGANALSYPCIEIQALTDTRFFDNTLRQLKAGLYHCVVLTSSNAVTILAERLQALGLLNTPIQLALVGEKTEQQVQDCLPNAQVLVVVPYAEKLHGEPTLAQKRILWVQSSQSQPLPDSLLHISTVQAYQTVIGQGGIHLSEHINRLHALTFFSGSAVRYFWQRATQEHLDSFQIAHLPVFCVGHSCAEVALSSGFQDVHSADHQLTNLLTLLESYFHETSR